MQRNIPEFPCGKEKVKIAHQLGDFWFELGELLHLTKLDLDDIEYRCHRNYEKALKVLNVWHEQFQHGKTTTPRSELAGAVETLQNPTLAKEILEGQVLDLLEKLGKELRNVYQKCISSVPLFQGESQPKFLDVEDVYTNLKLLTDISHPFEEPKVSLDSLQDIIKSEKKRTLLRGRAGSGKTTLLKKLTKMWAKEESDMSRFKLLFYLPMRYLKEYKTLGEAVKALLLAKDYTITAEDINQCICKYQSDVAILLDGYDEYLGVVKGDICKDSHQEESDLWNVLSFYQLRDARCIVSTRLWGIDHFLREVSNAQCYDQFEIVGFSPANVKHYVMDVCFKGHPDVGENLLEYIQSNGFMEGLACIPLTLDLFCRLWRNSRQVSIEPPETFSSLFTEMILCFYRHEDGKDFSAPLDKRNPFERADSIDERAFVKLIISLGQVAYKGLINKQQKNVFSVAEMNKILKFSDHQNFIDLGKRVGLLKSEDVLAYSGMPSLRCTSSDEEDEEDGSRHGATSNLLSFNNSLGDYLSFYHIHIQEKCAGVYLHNLYTSNERSFHKKLREIESVEMALNMKNVLLFACGYQFDGLGENCKMVTSAVLHRLLTLLNKSQEVSTSGEDSTLNQNFDLMKLLELCIQCCYEAQTEDQLSKVMTEIMDRSGLCLMNVSGYTKKAWDYFLSNSAHTEERKRGVPIQSCQIIELRPKFTMTYLRKLFLLVPNAQRVFESRMELYAKEDDKELQQRREGFEKELMIEVGECAEKMVTFTSDFTLRKQVAVLSVYQPMKRYQPSRSFCGLSVSSLLKNVPVHLKYLTLNVHGVHVPDMLKAGRNGNFHSLVLLDLSLCNFSSKETNKIGTIFFRMPNITSLNMSGNECGDNFMKNLCHMKKLEVLKLEMTSLSPSSVELLAKSLCHLSAVRSLDLRRNIIDVSSLQEILRSISQREDFKSLKLGLSGLKNKEEISVISVIGEKFKRLKELHLNHCQFPSFLISYSKNFLFQLKDLEDFRLSGLSPDASQQLNCWQGSSCVGNESCYTFQKIRLADEALTTFQDHLKALKKLKVLCLLYLKLDKGNINKICQTCSAMSMQNLKLFRYSRAGLSPEQASRLNDLHGKFLKLY